MTHSTTHPMTDTDPADLVRTYFDAAVDPDRERYLALFAPDPVVHDDGGTHVGRDAVREWRRGVPPVAYDVGVVAAVADGWEATVAVAGDFPGSPVDLRHRFRFDDDGLVAELTIRP